MGAVSVGEGDVLGAWLSVIQLGCTGFVPTVLSEVEAMGGVNGEVGLLVLSTGSGVGGVNVGVGSGCAGAGSVAAGVEIDSVGAGVGFDKGKSGSGWTAFCVFTSGCGFRVDPSCTGDGHTRGCGEDRESVGDCGFNQGLATGSGGGGV